MNLIKTLFISAILSLSFGSFSAKASECGKVQVAEMTWTSAAVLAYFDALVLKEGFGCDTEVVPGDTMPTSTSMAEKQRPDIASELWTNGLGAFWAEAMDRGVVKTGGLSMSGGW
jgi:glycine betaine/proline transport system substrate-binding protein